jgi:predicted ATPase/transcriptional regulator with XRE-family HTH domain
METALSFGRWLKQLRAELDMTQEVLAEQVGCSIETVRAFESGRRRPSRLMIERLADVLQVEADQRAEFVRLGRLSPEHTPQPDANERSSTPPTPVPPRYVPRLPIPPTTFIGRAQEVADVCHRLSEPTCHLLTLVGAGGTGKTRLALQVAANLTDRFADGVHFVALAQLMAADNVAAAVADAIGCPLAPAQSVEESLLHWLRDRNTLLVLDNFEHLLGAAPLLGSILREAPAVRLLVTSRERLRLQGEWVVDLEGLATPRDNSRDAIDRCEAVVLFLERARHVRSDFAITPANRAAVAEIVRLLEGMPLGIELAAAWVHMLTPDEITAEVQRGLDFLQLRARDANPRHRSMRAVIAHSWELLTPDEQRVMARFSIFRGGCTREAAERVVGTNLPILVSLLDKSLLRRTQAGRYEIHELVRQFAADQLAADPEDAAATQHRHATYYATWLRSRKPLLQGPQQQEAVAEITAEIDNLRAAWQLAIDRRDIDLFWLMTEGTVLTWFYELRSWYREAETITRRAVQVLGRSPLASRREEILFANLIGNQGWHTFRCGHPAEGIGLLEQSIDMLRPGDHPEFLFISLEQLAYLMLFMGDFERAIALVEEQGPVVQRITDPWLLAHARFQRAAVYVDRDPDLAYERFHEGLPYMRSVGDRYVVILTLGHLGEIALALGRLDEAEQSFTEVRELSSGIGNRIGEAGALAGLALVASARGAQRDAVSDGLQGVAYAREIGDTWTLAKALLALGVAEAGTGDLASAHRNLKEAVLIALSGMALSVAIEAGLRFAAVDLQHGRIDPPLSVFLASARNHPAVGRHTAERAEHLWLTLAQKLDPPTLADAERAAASGDITQAIRAYVETHPGWNDAQVRSLNLTQAKRSQQIGS